MRLRNAGPRLLRHGLIPGLLLQGAVVHAAAGLDELPTDRIFAPDSFWYRPLPDVVPLHPDSNAFVAEFRRQVKAYYGNVTINTGAYASPVYVVAPDAPKTEVVEWDCQRKGFRDRDLAGQWRAVPVPPAAQPARGSDAEMTIYQPSSDTLWEFWRMRRGDDGRWQACWGGRMRDVSRQEGIWHGHYGTTATGLPFVGGQITAEELRRGEIRHVIGIALVDTERAGVRSWPAQRSDGHNPQRKAHRIPEGLRFRLDPRIDVDALPLHPVAKTIARAAQQYGFVVWDKAGSVSLRAENPLSYAARSVGDPYRELFRGTPAYAVLKGFPWDRLQFLPMDYGRPESAGQ